MHFELKLEKAAEGGEGGVAFGESSGSIGAGGKPRVFSLKESTGCIPHVYDIAWGLLKPPARTVLVRTAGVLTRLREVAIPADLHAGGVIVYDAFAAPPTELIIRDGRGKTIQRESLAESAKASTERCEGETEPDGTTPSGGDQGSSVIIVGN